MVKVKPISLGAVLIAAVLASCAGGPLTTRERFTYGGGALGAGAGAIIGAASGSTATGAAIGGPIGLIGGYLIGDSLQGGTLPIRGGEARRSNYRVGGYSRKVNPESTSRTGADAENGKDSGQQYGEEQGGRVF